MTEIYIKYLAIVILNLVQNLDWKKWVRLSLRKKRGTCMLLMILGELQDEAQHSFGNFGHKSKVKGFKSVVIRVIVRISEHSGICQHECRISSIPERGMIAETCLRDKTP